MNSAALLKETQRNPVTSKFTSSDNINEENNKSGREKGRDGERERWTEG